MCPNEMGQQTSVGTRVNAKEDQNNYGRHERHSSQQGCERNPRVQCGTTGRQICFVSDCLHAITKKGLPMGANKNIFAADRGCFVAKT